MSTPRADWTGAGLQELTASGLSVSVEATTRAAASTDFGGICRGESVAVASPRTVEEVAFAVGFAAARGLSFTARGTGRSSGGQSVAQKGLTLDLSRLDHVGRADMLAKTLTCGPGARWRAVVDETLRHGLIPTVLPLNLDLTVAGTLSVGGFGSNSHRYGTAASHVAALQAVTGNGDLVDSAHDPGLLAVTLGGLGRCAVITSVTLALRAAPAAVRTFYLLYDEIEPWLSDLREFRDGRFDHMDGFCSSSVQGMRNVGAVRRPFARWFYGLHVSLEHAAGAAPEAEVALAGLHHRWVVHQEDNAPGAFAARADPRFEMMSRMGAFTQAHPWLECFVPSAALPELLPRVLAVLPLALGDGHRVAPLASAAQPPFLLTPEGVEASVFAVLPAGVAPALLPEVLPALRAANEMLIQAGGKRYLAGWLELDQAGWKAHYGDRYEDWLEAKRRYDPARVLGGMCF